MFCEWPFTCYQCAILFFWLVFCGVTILLDVRTCECEWTVIIFYSDAVVDVVSLTRTNQSSGSNITEMYEKSSEFLRLIKSVRFNKTTVMADEELRYRKWQEKCRQLKHFSEQIHTLTFPNGNAKGNILNNSYPTRVWYSLLMYFQIQIKRMFEEALGWIKLRKKRHFHKKIHA